MTKQQANKEFVKMLKEFPKAFPKTLSRISFRDRLMLRTVFDYVVKEVIGDIKANCDLAIEGRDIRIKELEQQIEQMKCCLSMWYEYENERDTPHINIDELLTETQQLIS